MQLLEINTEKTWRGGEKQTLLTAQGLKAKGVHVAILCRKDHPLARKAKKNDITCHEITGQVHAIIFLALHGRSYDIIHVQTAKAQGFAVFTKPFHKKKIVYTRRVDFTPRGYPARFKFRFTDKVVAISHAIADILKTFGVRTDKVIPSAIDLNASPSLCPPKIRESILKEKKSGKKIILTIAAQVPHKDPRTMLKAIQILHARHDNVIFLHCGSGELEREIREEVYQQNMQEYYKILGFVDNAESLLPLADVFVMSSQEEGLGSTVLEAFRYNIPVASTDAGGLKEIVPSNGLASPVHDAKALAQNIHTLLTDTQLREQLTKQAHAYVTRYHSRDTMVEHYIALFEQMT